MFKRKQITSEEFPALKKSPRIEKKIMNPADI